MLIAVGLFASAAVMAVILFQSLETPESDEVALRKLNDGSSETRGVETGIGMKDAVMPTSAETNLVYPVGMGDHRQSLEERHPNDLSSDEKYIVAARVRELHDLQRLTRTELLAQLASTPRGMPPEAREGIGVRGDNWLDFRHSELAGIDLERTNISYVDLSESDLGGANLKDADLRDTRLSYANLADADLRGADLRVVKMTFADLRGTNLRNVDASDLQLDDGHSSMSADFTAADLRGADLRGANLRGAAFMSADLRGANLEGADLNHAWYDSRTRFPEGFDPCSPHRMIRVLLEESPGPLMVRSCPPSS